MLSRRSLRFVARGALAGAIAVLAVAAWGSAGAGCTTHQCDDSTVALGTVGTFYRDGSEIVWETSGQTGPWISFAGNQTLQIDFPVAFQPVEWQAYVGTDPGSPDAAPGNSVNAAGQLAEVTAISPTGIQVLNSSCQLYFLRLTARGPALDDDAGVDVGATSPEAGAPPPDAGATE